MASKLNENKINWTLDGKELLLTTLCDDLDWNISNGEDTKNIQGGSYTTKDDKQFTQKELDRIIATDCPNLIVHLFSPEEELAGLPIFTINTADGILTFGHFLKSVYTFVNTLVHDPEHKFSKQCDCLKNLSSDEAFGPIVYDLYRRDSKAPVYCFLRESFDSVEFDDDNSISIIFL